MRINLKNNNVAFASLGCGDLFVFDDDVFIKTKTIRTEKEMINCVNLGGGEYCNIDPEAVVRKVKCELNEI